MGLFMCSKCNAIENSNNISLGRTDDESYPNKTLMEMCGFLKDRPNEEAHLHIEMLCTECNSGVWYSDNDKHIATLDEMVVADLSQYNYTTPYDHPKDSICVDNSIYSGFSVTFQENIRRPIADRERNKKAVVMGAIGGLMASAGMDLDSFIPRKYRTKERYVGQTDSERTFKLLKAEEKRERKRLKKLKNKG